MPAFWKSSYFCVTKDTPVWAVKTRIQNLYCIPARKQRLFWQGNELQDTAELKDHDIQVELWPELRLVIVDTMKIQIIPDSGSDYITLEVEPACDTVWSLKQRINLYPATQQLLLYNCLPLINDRTLEDHGLIYPNSFIRLMRDQSKTQTFDISDDGGWSPRPVCEEEMMAPPRQESPPKSRPSSVPTLRTVLPLHECFQTVCNLHECD